MANRTTANLLKAQAKLISAFQSSELRFRFPATYLALKVNSGIMFPNYEDLRKREDRTVETLYNIRAKRSLGTGGRSHNHTGSKADTATLTPTWTTYDDKFNMSLKQADNSHYDAQEQMNSELMNIVANFMEGYETAATAYLFANRSGVNNATAEGTFDATDDVFEILAANEDRAIQITKIALDANKYPSGATIFCDSIAYAKFEYQAAQGQSNNANLSFQFNGVTFVHSVELGALGAGLVSAYAKGFWIVVPTGTVATLPWIPIQNRRGNSQHAPISVYSSIINPVDGETYAVHTYSTAADDSANNGFTQDVVMQYQISQDLAFAKAPSSTANETTILAFAIV
jgi:hypothetical protein